MKEVMVKIIENKIRTFEDTYKLVPQRELTFLFFASNESEIKPFIDRLNPKGNLKLLINSDPFENEHFDLPAEKPSVAAFAGSAFLATHILKNRDEEKEFLDGVYHLAEGLID